MLRECTLVQVDLITHLTMKACYRCMLGRAGTGHYDRTSVEDIDFTRLLSEANVFSTLIKIADNMTGDKTTK